MDVEKRKELLLVLEELFYLQPGTLTGKEALKDFSYWDSMATLSFMSALDEKFGVQAAPDDIVKCKTIDDLISLAVNQTN